MMSVQAAEPRVEQQYSLFWFIFSNFTMYSTWCSLFPLLKYFLKMVNGPPGFSVQLLFSFLYAYQNVTDSWAPPVPVFCSVFSKRYYDCFILSLFFLTTRKEKGTIPYQYSNVDPTGRLIKAMWKKKYTPKWHKLYSGKERYANIQNFSYNHHGHKSTCLWKIL